MDRERERMRELEMGTHEIHVCAKVAIRKLLKKQKKSTVT